MRAFSNLSGLPSVVIQLKPAIMIQKMNHKPPTIVRNCKIRPTKVSAPVAVAGRLLGAVMGLVKLVSAKVGIMVFLVQRRWAGEY